MRAKANDVHNVAPEVVIDFLRQTLPFKELDLPLLQEIAARTLIDFFPKGTLIFRQGATEVHHLHLIQKGGVKLYIKDAAGEITLMDFRGEGEYFGALPIIQGGIANLNIETVEDTFCFLIDKEIVLQLIGSQPLVANYFLRSMSAKLVNTAYAELRGHRIAPRTESSLYLFSARVQSIVKNRLYTVPAGQTVQEAARLMAEKHIGSLLVEDEKGGIVGIVTDKDMRTKVVAVGLDFHSPVAGIMSSPVRTVPARAVGFDALLTMMDNRIHHLAVEQQGRIVGMITTHDIMVLQGNSPLYFFREILAQRRIENLYDISRKIPGVVRALIEEGAKADNITRMITVLNDQVLDRLLSLLIEELGPPPLPFCWLLLGSEGRREQTFRTDQDNALIYEDSGDPAMREGAEIYFRELGEKAIPHLVGCGFPLCPGEIMASNPKWRQPVSGWRRYFDQWLHTPNPLEIRHSSIFFDFRSGFGKKSLAEELRAYLAEAARPQEIFLLHLAKDCLEMRPPLSFFRSFIVEKDGEHKNTLDIKKRGLLPFIDFARLKSLQCGVKESNTLERLQMLVEGEHIVRDLYTETVEAYEFLMQLRLVHQMQQLEDGLTPDNHINPGDLSDLEKQTLKEAFRVIRRLQSTIRQDFRLGEG